MKKKLVVLVCLVLSILSVTVHGQEPVMVLLDIPVYNQQSMGLNTGCELVSLYMVVNYRNEAGIDELLAQMPYSSEPRQGFRGNLAGARRIYRFS